jgi:hypothetical protein
MLAFLLSLDYYLIMNSKHLRTLSAIFANPVNGALEWSRIEALLVALGCEVQEGNGSAVTFIKNGEKLRLHRPHPYKESLKYRVVLVREFFAKIGVTP